MILFQVVEDGASTSANTTSESESQEKDDDKDSKKKKNRCAVCRKKVGLTGNYFKIKRTNGIINMI